MSGHRRGMKPFRTSFIAVVIIGCGGSVDLPQGAGTATGTTSSFSAVGEPCTFSMENDVTFRGFSPYEVNLQSGEVGGVVCLADHFRGRVSCPAGGSACLTPRGEPVVAKVEPQCAKRSPERAVYVSCRCANVYDRTDDGDDYCTCPTSFDCRQLVSKVGSDRDHLSGAYCTKPGTRFDASSCVTR